jgi:hypothetical protein
MIDAVATGISGPVGMGVGAPVEMLLRSNIYFSKELRIPVKDWDSCEGGWAGNVNYTKSWHWVHSGPNGDWQSTEARDHTTRAEVRLRGNPDGSTGWSGTSYGTASIVFNGKHLAVDHGPLGCTCQLDETTTAVGAGDSNVQISPHADNKYEIRSTFPTVPSSTLQHRSCSGCKGKTPPDQSSTSIYEIGFPPVIAQEDPNQPGVLHGSTTLPGDTAGETVDVKWNLTQCKDRR